MSESVDIAIIGGGSSGLSLARELSQLERAPSTLVIEPKSPQERDCSWALWAQQSTGENYSTAVKGRWPSWQLIDHNGSVTHTGSSYQYLSLSAAKYLTDCESQLKPPVSVHRDEVKSLKSLDKGGLITTRQSTIHAQYIYDSRPVNQPRFTLRQHFLGWEIKTKQPLDNPSVATLMDFRTDQSQGLHFIYVLPFSSRHILVESTLVSRQLQHKDWYRQAIQAWLQDRGIEVAEHISEEYGVIPLEVQPTATQAIGTASGAIRRSSGYGFTTIQKQTKALATAITQGNYNVPKPISSYLNMMDSIFNAVLLNYPQLSSQIFMRTAKVLNGDQFARFMLGQADAFIWAKVIAAMPKAPFLKQMISRHSGQVPLEQY